MQIKSRSSTPTTFTALLVFSLLTANFILMPLLLLEIEKEFLFEYICIGLLGFFLFYKIRRFVAPKGAKKSPGPDDSQELSMRVHISFKKMMGNFFKNLWSFSKKTLGIILLLGFILVVVYINHKLY